MRVFFEDLEVNGSFLLNVSAVNDEICVGGFKSQVLVDLYLVFLKMYSEVKRVKLTRSKTSVSKMERIRVFGDML